MLLEPGVWITAPGGARVRIGAGTFLNLGVMVAAQELVEIGEHCMLANGCFVSDANHRFDDPDKPITWQGFESKGPTRIGDNCWLGANVVVTSGVTHRRALRDRREQRRHARHRGRSRSPRAAPARVIQAEYRGHHGPSGATARARDGRLKYARWTCTRRCAARRRAGSLPMSRSRRRSLAARAGERALRARAAATARAGASSSYATPSVRRALARALPAAVARLHGADRRRADARGPGRLRPGSRVRMVRPPTSYARAPRRGARAPRGRRAAGRPRGDRRAACRARASSAARRSTRSCRTCCSRCAPKALGAAMTTLLVPAEAEVRRLLEIPDEIALAAHVGVGHRADPWPRGWRATRSRSSRSPTAWASRSPAALTRLARDPARAEPV